MKKIKIIFIFIIFVSIFSCKDFFDVNHDPNRTEKSRMDLTFPAGVENSASVIGNSFMSLGGIWAQHWTSDINMPGFMGEDAYNVQSGDYSYDLRGWSSLYSGALMDYEWVKNQASDNEDWNYYLMATVMQCYTYQVLADLWDQIPVTEALQSELAKFENGKQVYDILIDRLNYALSRDFSANSNSDTRISDVVFNGNINNWKAFANTLKLKLFIRQRFIHPDAMRDSIQTLFDNNTVFLSSDAAFLSFKDERGYGNYWFESNYRGKPGALRASNTLLKYLQTQGDGRLNYIYQAPGSHRGLWQGDFRNKFDSYGDEDEPKFSKPIITPMDPVLFISEAESYFLQAEAKMIINSPVSEVADLYDDGIEASFRRFGVETVSGVQDFPSGGTLTQQFEALMMQKWIAFANGQGLEAFFEINRTHIPKHSPVSPGEEGWNALTYGGGELLISVEGYGRLAPPNYFPKRLMFSATERSNNSNTPPTQPINIPVWWEVENPTVE